MNQALEGNSDKNINKAFKIGGEFLERGIDTTKELIEARGVSVTFSYDPHQGLSMGSQEELNRERFINKYVRPHAGHQ